MTELVLNSLVKTYGGRDVVGGVSIHVESNRVTGLLGPNGAGKTTTFYMAAGIVRPDAGSVFIDNQEITTYPVYKRARCGIGYLPQESSIFKSLSVRDNVMAILELLDISKQEQEERLETLLNELRISHLADRKAAVLSGGERRRLEITRVLAIKPAFILLDEPFAGVDPIAVIDIQNIIAMLKERGIGILISDHNVRETLGVCDNAYIMSDGKVIESGSPEEIASSDIARRIYLGEGFTL
ncbi:LPS export ABC transporter ATP-binding protein [Desulfoluna spongiiphila]|uniref:Lipopolysaccharide export system ATP-binding protein n=1 Tax=Desulfoluna spongiiphila TaxID=419481 RepID=A0A1G5JCN1_9BACT|nr:LPS export ABC transporter ATP-binding protein [Desulfoluna spongiiphila]SCY86102.1 lipopolysaccharide export system ATP-binding protein [Desulfoluna spongiiphila]VVS90837.1 lps export abc transporter atp-binding protein lptb [Desulfoluna spongiiphila]